MLGVPCSLCTSKGGIDQGGHTQVVRMYTIIWVNLYNATSAVHKISITRNFHFSNNSFNKKCTRQSTMNKFICGLVGKFFVSTSLI